MYIACLPCANTKGRKMPMTERTKVDIAKEEYDKVIADEHERDLIAQRERYWLDYNSMRNALKSEGYDKGKEAGMKAGMKERNKRKANRNCKKIIRYEYENR